MVIKGEYIQIWKDTATAYMTVPSQHPLETLNKTTEDFRQ